MTGEAPQPEIEHVPEAHLFNVGAMDDEQIMILSRGLTAMMGVIVGPESNRGAVADDLLVQLDADLRDLISRDPERVRNLADRCAKSLNETDRELAVQILPGLLDHYYEFTRDTLISLCDDQDRPHSEGLASDGAALAIHDLRQGRLTPDQVADFEAQLAARRYAEEF
jgi:hypothetical protein